MKKLTKNSVTALAVAGIIGSAGVAMASQNDGQAPSPNARVANTVMKCDGGKQLKVFTRIAPEPTTFGEGSTVTLPTVMNFNGPSTGTDVFNITLTAESQLSGTSDFYDWINLEAKLDGVALQPHGATGSPIAINGSPYYLSSGNQFCVRVGPGTHQLKFEATVVDNGTDNSLSAWIDDVVLKVERSE